MFPAVDNDDGSAYYWIASNVVAYGGFKNFIGNDKERAAPQSTTRDTTASHQSIVKHCIV